MLEFGKKIKELRLSKKMSRPEFCGDESELSVRQLIRIENGESRPTLAKLTYIADRLGIEDYKLMPDYKELDKEYLELKYFLMRTPTYGDENLSKKKELVFDQIFEKYYVDLPEEEKLIIDILQAYVDFYQWNDDSNIQLILQDYFEQIQLKVNYTVNDLLIINLFLLRLVHDDTVIDAREKRIFLELAAKILEQAEKFDIDNSFLMRDSLLLLLGIFEKLDDYGQFEEILCKLNSITSKSYDYQKKPIIRAWEWRFALFSKGDYLEAERYFQEAKLFAKTIDNAYLLEQLEKQWESDLEDFFKKKQN